MKAKLFYRSIAMFLVICCSCPNTRAADVKQVTTHSRSMNKDIGAIVITPEGYSAETAYPVLYLLHGYSGNENDWITKVPEIGHYADQYQFIIVCPDGAYSSWYFDSPVDKNMKYETYIADELVARFLNEKQVRSGDFPSGSSLCA